MAKAKITPYAAFRVTRDKDTSTASSLYDNAVLLAQQALNAINSGRGVGESLSMLRERLEALDAVSSCLPPYQQLASAAVKEALNPSQTSAPLGSLGSLSSLLTAISEFVKPDPTGGAPALPRLREILSSAGYDAEGSGSVRIATPVAGLTREVEAVLPAAAREAQIDVRLRWEDRFEGGELKTLARSEVVPGGQHPANRLAEYYAERNLGTLELAAEPLQLESSTPYDAVTLTSPTTVLPLSVLFSSGLRHPVDPSLGHELIHARDRRLWQNGEFSCFRVRSLPQCHDQAAEKEFRGNLLWMEASVREYRNYVFNVHYAINQLERVHDHTKHRAIAETLIASLLTARDHLTIAEPIFISADRTLAQGNPVEMLEGQNSAKDRLYLFSTSLEPGVRLRTGFERRSDKTTAEDLADLKTFVEKQLRQVSELRKLFAERWSLPPEQEGELLGAAVGDRPFTDEHRRKLLELLKPLARGIALTLSQADSSSAAPVTSQLVEALERSDLLVAAAERRLLEETSWQTLDNLFHRLCQNGDWPRAAAIIGEMLPIARRTPFSKLRGGELFVNEAGSVLTWGGKMDTLSDLANWVLESRPDHIVAGVLLMFSKKARGELNLETAEKECREILTANLSPFDKSNIETALKLFRETLKK